MIRYKINIYLIFLSPYNFIYSLSSANKGIINEVPVAAGIRAQLIELPLIILIE